MYTIVTGAAGFIGSNIVKALNERGVSQIIAVDNLTRADKFKNLVDCEIADYFDKNEFIERLKAGQFNGRIDAIFHEGACSDTMETDGRYMMENNSPLFAGAARLVSCPESAVSVCLKPQRMAVAASSRKNGLQKRR